jgi:hypothetical protein
MPPQPPYYSTSSSDSTATTTTKYYSTLDVSTSYNNNDMTDLPAKLTKQLSLTKLNLFPTTTTTATSLTNHVDFVTTTATTNTNVDSGDEDDLSDTENMVDHCNTPLMTTTLSRHGSSSFMESPSSTATSTNNTNNKSTLLIPFTSPLVLHSKSFLPPNNSITTTTTRNINQQSNNNNHHHHHQQQENVIVALAPPPSSSSSNKTNKLNTTPPTIETLPTHILFMISQYLFNTVDMIEPCVERKSWIDTCKAFQDASVLCEHPARMTFRNMSWGQVISRINTMSPISTTTTTATDQCSISLRLDNITLPGSISESFQTRALSFRSIKLRHCHVNCTAYWSLLEAAKNLQVLCLEECVIPLIDRKYEMPITDPIASKSHSRACSFLSQFIELPIFPSSLTKVHIMYPRFEWIASTSSSSTTSTANNIMMMNTTNGCDPFVRASSSSEPTTTTTTTSNCDNPLQSPPSPPSDSVFQISLQDSDRLGSLLYFACLRRSFRNFHTVGVVYAHTTVHSLLGHHGFEYAMPTFLHGNKFFNHFSFAPAPPDSSPLWIISKTFNKNVQEDGSQPHQLYLIDRVESVDDNELRQSVCVNSHGEVESKVWAGEILERALQVMMIW